MKTLDKEQDKIAMIMEALRKETLEPAQTEAQKIIDGAKKQAEGILAEADKQSKQIIEKAKGSIEQERNVFHSSLVQAAKQSIEALRQEIEKTLFNSQLDVILETQTADPKLIAALVNAIVQAIEKEGLKANLEAVIPKQTSPREVNQLLLKGVADKLKDHSVTLGTFKGGAQVKLIDRRLTIDITEGTLKELLASFVRKDFRKIIFNA